MAEFEKCLSADCPYRPAKHAHVAGTQRGSRSADDLLSHLPHGEAAYASEKRSGVWSVGIYRAGCASSICTVAEGMDKNTAAWMAVAINAARSRNGPNAHELVALLDSLRLDEGSTVTLHGNNSDFNGMPNCLVECSGEWTGWVDRRYRADTIVECLRKAKAERDAFEAARNGRV